MARGHIDSLTTSGLVEGWAYDEARPSEPLGVTVATVQGGEVATGYANQYRRDLAEAGHAHGWCYFRLALEIPLEVARMTPLRLIETRTGALICGCEPRQVRDTKPYEVCDLDELLRCDPTVIDSLEQLEGFEDVLQTFVETRGVEAFARAAYLYVLGRAIDETGLSLYGRLIHNNHLSPYAMLLTLADSQEFRAGARGLAAPGQSGFPFWTA